MFRRVSVWVWLITACDMHSSCFLQCIVMRRGVFCIGGVQPENVGGDILLPFLFSLHAMCSCGEEHMRMCWCTSVMVQRHIVPTSM